jgi:hypothetical protein
VADLHPMTGNLAELLFNHSQVAFLGGWTSDQQAEFVWLALRLLLVGRVGHLV